MSKTVLVVGAGIIGPTIAIMLRKKGYEVIIVERIRRPEAAAGVSLSVQPNGLKVLDTIGLANMGKTCHAVKDFNSEGEYLGGLDLSHAKEQYGFLPVFVRRAVLLQRIKDEAIQQGVQIHEDWELKDIQETEDEVVAIATDGRRLTASFLLGCDGLHSTTRKIINRKHGISELPADSTGQLSLGGMGPIPKSLLPQTVCFWLGDSRLVVAHEVDEERAAWVMIVSTALENETWRRVDKVEETKAELLGAIDTWPATAKELVGSAETIVRFGHFDRPSRAPEHWFHKRCVLLGDAAHPSSPFRGQGANQGLEDCWVLAQQLPNAGDHQKLSTPELGKTFARYAEQRQRRTATTVRAARGQSTQRMVTGDDAARSRDRAVREKWADQEAARAEYHDLWKEPY